MPIIVRREDFTIRNRRNLKLHCSIYIPVRQSKHQDRKQCILYCHGASGGRLDGITDVWELGMQLEASLCVFDFAGCGKSEGEYITLGMWEEDDVRCMVRKLIEDFKYEHIVLWGRSMGAVACTRFAANTVDDWIPPPQPITDKEYNSWTQMQLVDLVTDLQQQEDSDCTSAGESASVSAAEGTGSEKKSKRIPRSGTGTVYLTESKSKLIARIKRLTEENRKIEESKKESVKGYYMKYIRCLVLDSPFANLWDAARHIIEHYRSVVPAFMMRGIANVGLPIVRKSILKQVPQFDIKKIETLSAAQKCTIPVMILHAVNDNLIPWKESRRLYDAYGAKSKSTLDISSNPLEKENQRKSRSKEPRQSSTNAMPSKPEPGFKATGGESKEKGPKINFTVANRSSSSPDKAQFTKKALSQKEKHSAKDEGKGRVARQYILIDGDHNSLRPAGYYDAVAVFLSRFIEGKNPTFVPATDSPESAGRFRGLSPTKDMEHCLVPAVVPFHMRESEEMRFFYGVAVVSEFTDEQVKLESEEVTNDKDNPLSSGVSCTVRTVSFSWRMVLGLHPKRGLLIFRPYSGISLYAVSFAELLSFSLQGPSQLRFMFLDGRKTQRRVRFYSPEVPVLKELIDRAFRKLVSHDHLTGKELIEKVKNNLKGASAALVEKRLLNSRGLSPEEVAEIIDSLCTAIRSMLEERDPDEIPADLDPEGMVEKAVLKAVEERTGWKLDIAKIPTERRTKKGWGRCLIS